MTYVTSKFLVLLY